MKECRCIDCGVIKRSQKSLRCHSCARKKQHEANVYKSTKLDCNDTERQCSFCKTSHPWQYGKTNDFWLLRKSIPHHSYECKSLRKYKYLENRKNISKRLRKQASNLVRDALAKHGAYKNGSFIKHVGWTVEELKTHLESKFQPGMSWDNYGRDGWHLDHKTPDSWFSYSSAEDEGFKQSWSLDNLQPLWEKDNCRKSNRYSD